MSFQLTAQDRKRMLGIHPDLTTVIERAAEISKQKFKVLEGRRSVERQKQLVASGASKTMNSRHLTGHAIDIAPVDEAENVSWSWPLYYDLAKTVKQAAKDVGVPIEWGGDWKSFKDGPHWQLPWKSYPASDVPPEASKAAPMQKESLAKSRTVQGAAAATAGGVTLFAEVADQLSKADSVSTGTILGSIAAVLVILGALYALYARWDDAGRPLFWR